MSRADFGSIIGQLVSILLDRAHGSIAKQAENSTVADLPIWATPLELATRDRSVDVAALRSHLLPTLFKRNATDFSYFLENIGLHELLDLSTDSMRHDNNVQMNLLCAVLQAGKNLDIGVRDRK